MIALLLLQCLTGLFAFVVFYNFYWKRRNLPPGPAPLPIVGNMLTLAKYDSPEDAFIQWRKDYGDV